MSRKIEIFDTTLRDGEQVPGCQLSTQEKVVIAKALEDLGVDVIEAGFPISSPGDFLSVIEISKAVKTGVCALTRAKKDDIDVAAESLKYATRGRIHTGLGSSDVHIKTKFNSTREKMLELASWAVSYAKGKGVAEVEFYAEDAGRADLEFLAQLIETVISAGADVVNIPDTTGYCLPHLYGARIKYLIDHVSNIDKAIISVHCHNDLGLATANTIAGLMNGAGQAEVTINGIGERAGNTALEEVAMILKKHKDLGLITNIKPEKIYTISHLVSDSMRMHVQPNKAIVGANAFAHSSGIHQDGFLKNAENYEIIDPSEVGVPSSSIILTARSGRAALKHRLHLLGYELNKDELNTVYESFLAVADEKKTVHDEDLITLCANTAILSSK